MEATVPFISLWVETGSQEMRCLHLLTREKHLTLPLPELKAKTNAIEEILPALAELLPGKASLPRTLFLLEPSLPRHWQTYPWEQLSLHGKNLSRQMLIVRQASWNDQPEARPRQALFLDLFPQDEFSFVASLQPLIKSGQLRTCRNDPLLGGRLQTATDLFIMAHGKAQGLLDAKGEPFALPLSHPMPERIWLLACNVDGAMHTLARQLLENGCKTVVTATGDLSAPQMASLVESCFANDNATRDPASTLVFNEAKCTGKGSHTDLTTHGSVQLDQTGCSSWNRMTWESEHGCNPSVPLDDEIGREQFYEAYQHAISTQAWSLTRTWMMRPLLWLAEKLDHRVMLKIQTEVGDAGCSPEAIRGLAAAARRVGNYVQVARYLSLGLKQENLTEKDRSDRLGSLVNLLIDLDLPESAKAVITQHEDCDLNNPAEIAKAEFKRLDWQARTEARCGNLHLALDFMTTKRKRSPAADGRELAGQLYLAAWGQFTGQIAPETARTLAAEARQILQDIHPQEIGSGNESAAYLLRALAAWAWAGNDTVAKETVLAWRDHALEQLTEADPGPWAYVLAFLHLMNASPVKHFEQAMSALERARYYLEAGMFWNLAAQIEESASDRVLFQKNGQRLYERFQERRTAILKELTIPAIVSSKYLEDENKCRLEKEQLALGDKTIAVRYGALPL